MSNHCKKINVFYSSTSEQIGKYFDKQGCDTFSIISFKVRKFIEGLEV